MAFNLEVQVIQHVPEFWQIGHHLWAVSGNEKFCLGIFQHV